MTPRSARALLPCLLVGLCRGFSAPSSSLSQRRTGSGPGRPTRPRDGERLASSDSSPSTPGLGVDEGGRPSPDEGDPVALFPPSESRGTRRGFFASAASSALVASLAGPSLPARAEGGKKSTADAAVTDKIFIDLKGVPGGPADGSPDRITIGLFGNDAPQPVSILKRLVTKEGYPSQCKPLDATRTLQKEQLEANKVYNSCLEGIDAGLGVNYDYATVWRIVADERIDLGAVSGRYVARENPTFEDAGSGLTHDARGVVSVRRGDEGGYGFTIYPGGGAGTSAASMLDEDQIVVGRVVDGMDVVGRLNAMPVVRSAGVNYMALTGGPKEKVAPSRGCRYGGSELYCNENKPLKKVLLDKTGLL
ncbi:hypothetical protein ACHAWF_017640 [Thalassiosira exigua]